MSNLKITPKNLSYDASLPPFLQRLRTINNSSGLDGRHEFATARPKRARDADADAEDEPAYVDEETKHTLSKEEYAALVAGKEDDAAAVDGDSTEGLKYGNGMKGRGEDEVREKEKLAAIGASRKRKAVKVVGIVSDEEEAKSSKDGYSKAESSAGKVMENPSKTTKKGKGKKIKLSFNDDGI